MAIHLPSHIATVANPIEVTIDPGYLARIRDLATLSLRVTDPTGGVQSIPVTESWDGRYTATISGLVYKGAYEVVAIAETGAGSWRAPLEFSSETGQVPVPPLRMAASDAFFVVDGVDVAPKPRPEEE